MRYSSRVLNNPQRGVVILSALERVTFGKEDQVKTVLKFAVRRQNEALLLRALSPLLRYVTALQGAARGRGDRVDHACQVD